MSRRIVTLSLVACALLIALGSLPDSAMQAEARQRLLQCADEAAHERKKAALELERELREQELKTERIIQEKNREIRRAELETKVAIEDARAELVRRKADNEAKLAEVRTNTLRETVEAIREVDWRTLAASGETDSKRLIAMAFGELAENARRIGRLDISPELLRELMEE